MSTNSFIYFLTKSYKAYEQVTFSCLSSTLRIVAMCICLCFAACICLRIAACTCLRFAVCTCLRFAVYTCLRFALTDRGCRKGDPAPRQAHWQKRPAAALLRGRTFRRRSNFYATVFSSVISSSLCSVICMGSRMLLSSFSLRSPAFNTSSRTGTPVFREVFAISAAFL